jgi:hypothetical protein
MARLLIEIARRRQRPGSGSAPAAPTPPTFAVNLRHVLSTPFAVIGGQATKAYMPARHTLDWDVLVHADDLPRARADLERANAHSFVALTIPGFSCRLATGEALDVIACNAPWVADALAHPNRDESGEPILRLPYLVLMKLVSARVQDLADISRMLAWAEAAVLADCRSVVAAHLPDAGGDLESLLELGRLEHGQGR